MLEHAAKAVREAEAWYDPNVSGSSSSADDLLKKKKDFVEQFFRKGAEFAADLLRENEALRFDVLRLEQALTEGGKSIPERASTNEFVEKISRLQSEHNELRERFEEMERRNKEFASRYAEVESENNNLASLYVAASQLQSVYDLPDAITVVTEILLNFVGVKSFVIFVADENHKLRPWHVVSERQDDTSMRLVDGVVAKVFGAGVALSRSGDSNEGPLHCLPLLSGVTCVGVIAVWELFEQKHGLSDSDMEMFSLLQQHAAHAIEAAVRWSRFSGERVMTFGALAKAMEGAS